MNLNTTYLGLDLRSPLVASASPLSETVTGIRRLEDAGAGAIVLYSLFEEQIRQEQLALHHNMVRGTESYAEALSYFPEPADFNTDSRGYLELIAKAKKVVDVPIIASLNGNTPGSWAKFARRIEEAGADALELNLYGVPTNVEMPGAQVEHNDLEVVRTVCSSISIPVAVKISPFFSNIANMAKHFAHAGAKGLVMFNRFYQPDIDLESLEVKPNVLLSTPQALRMPLRWIAILYGRINVDFAGTGGVHSGGDAAKLLLVGAQVAMMASSLLKHGAGYIQTVEKELRTFMAEHEYTSVAQMRGALCQINCEDPAAYERAQYMRALTHYSSEVLP